MAGGGGLAVDPYALPVAAAFGHWNPSGKTRVDAAPVEGQSTAVFLVFGQSKADNTVIGDTYSTVNLTNHNLSLADGAVYRSAAGLLGNSIPPENALYGHSYLTRLADKVITGGSRARVITVPMCVGSASITTFSTGGTYADRYAYAKRRLDDRGLTCTHILFDQGETDAINGMSAATYTAHVQAIRSLLTAAGLTAAMYVAKATLHPSASSGNQTIIRTGQTNAVNGTTILAGPDLDAVAGRDGSGVHFNTTGSDAAASAWKTALGL